jgi:hypothetical protein
LKEYRLSRVTGDKYAGETFKSAFEKEGIGYQVSQLTKHEIYEATEVLFNTGSAVLLDHELTESQFLGLIWRGGRIDHPNNEHDDWCNAAAGAAHLASKNKTFNPRALPIGVGKGTRWLTMTDYYSRDEDTENVPNGATIGARLK